MSRGIPELEIEIEQLKIPSRMANWHSARIMQNFRFRISVAKIEVSGQKRPT
jgi:hypothetical protein